MFYFDYWSLYRWRHQYADQYCPLRGLASTLLTVVYCPEFCRSSSSMTSADTQQSKWRLCSWPAGSICAKERIEQHWPANISLEVASLFLIGSRPDVNESSSFGEMFPLLCQLIQLVDLCKVTPASVHWAAAAVTSWCKSTAGNGKRLNSNLILLSSLLLRNLSRGFQRPSLSLRWTKWSFDKRRSVGASVPSPAAAPRSSTSPLTVYVLGSSANRPPPLFPPSAAPTLIFWLSQRSR